MPWCWDSQTYTRNFRPLRRSTNTLAIKVHFISCPWCTRVALYPLESGSSLIMSTEITCQHQSGTLLGISFPTFCVGKVFVWLHALHPAMNLATYLDSPGHQ